MDSENFNAIFAFDAPALDPIFIFNHFISVIFEYSVFGRETIWWTFKRSGSSEVLGHTSVYARIEGKMYRMRSANKKCRPNGDDIRCCGQVPRYVRSSETKVTFRCLQTSHPLARMFKVPLLLPQEGRRWVCGDAGRCRYMIDLV